MTCKMTGTYIGHHNLSYILDDQYGRSLPDAAVLTVSSLNKLAMFQTYAEVNRVSPPAGSLEGGTILTIEGRYFDETDRPATVLVGGQDCLILSLSDERLTCVTPKHQINNMTVFPGGRGLKMEVWNNSRPGSLDEALGYDETRPGYSVRWVDSLSYTWPQELDNFVARLSGFFVPTETDSYTFYIKGDDRCALYFSLTGLPRDKVKIAYQNGLTSDYFRTREQRSTTMLLEKGKPYYIEVLVQDYQIVGYVDVGFFKEKSPFTAQQSAESTNEIQTIRSAYDVLPEKQVLSFGNWTPVEPVKEVQVVTVNSSCLALDTCDYTFYSLKYNSHSTGPIPVSASAEDVQNALNSLWSIKPDTVQVTRADLSTGAEYTVVFDSRRGDYQTLRYETAADDANITVTELTKGKPSLETFTLEWGGTYSKPMRFNANESEVQSALKLMLSAECPGEVVVTETRDVKYFQDYEDGQPFVAGGYRGTRVLDAEAFCGRGSLLNPEVLYQVTDPRSSGTAYGPVPLQQYGTLCFAYKGYLRNEIGVVFSYQSSGGVRTAEFRIPVILNHGYNWNYVCVDLLTPLQTEYSGCCYNLLQFSLYRETSTQDFYVDAVYLGKRPTTINVNAVVQARKPPALVRSGLYVQDVAVRKIAQKDASRASYEITASPYNCGHDFPLLSVAFLQVSNRSQDTALFREGGADVTVTRAQRASPPLSGTFDAEIYGERVEGLSVDISPEDLQYALQGIPEMGLVQVTRSGGCTGYSWRVQWLSNPGAQPLIQINSSSVLGVNPRVWTSLSRRGGLFKSSILGDFLRVPESRPQVEVLINGIPSKCSGDCGFEWSAAKTPVVTGVSPAQGSYALDTVLTITGSGFNSENATVLIGDVKCSVLQINNSSLTCRVGGASAGTVPVSVSLTGLGHAHYSQEAGFNFTNQLGVVSISPSSGSTAGGALLTVTGYGFSGHTTVLIGGQRCAVLSANLDRLQCRTPPGTAGARAVTVEVGEMSASAGDPFVYDADLTPVITSTSPLRTSVLGRASLTIEGMNFQNRTQGSSVLIGERECRIQLWLPNNITCFLPQLPPALYNVNVRAGNWGYAKTNDGGNATIEYVLEVASVSPTRGSLYGGTRVTVTGSGFSSGVPDNRVSIGGTPCEVTAASEHRLECVTRPEERTHAVTNQGSHPSYGEGYAWSPSSLTVSVGDTVAWRWDAPPFVAGLGYGVYSVASPSSTAYDGVSFTSGDAKTESGFFSHRFTAPGVYYYSSGFVDASSQKFLQGVVKVLALEDRRGRLNLTVGGIEAQYRPGAPLRDARSAAECVSSVPDCSGFAEAPAPADGFYFSFLGCLSPVVHHIRPGSGTFHDVIHIEGAGFGNASCANEVTVGEPLSGDQQHHGPDELSSRRTAAWEWASPTPSPSWSPAWAWP
ncbi:hypothetical protein ANANG_G00183390 [Anguilla anguilla]|uniref:PA14 domain-containing protein n=1 Tax=Anguilla anguilla TaxID=7936 RepID=A0A9D3M8Y6_ANGAN|nr:hypothetical protein ANANG_G00183390 [Anguilla anguilla]